MLFQWQFQWHRLQTQAIGLTSTLSTISWMCPILCSCCGQPTHMNCFISVQLFKIVQRLPWSVLSTQCKSPAADVDPLTASITTLIPELWVTKLPANLRPTTCKCVHRVSGTDMTPGISHRHADMLPMDDAMCWDCWPSGPVVFMRSLKRRSGRITADVFLLVWPLPRWPSYTNLTRTLRRYIGCANINFVRQGFQKLSPYIHRPSKLYTMPLCGWSINSSARILCQLSATSAITEDWLHCTFHLMHAAVSCLLCVWTSALCSDCKLPSNCVHVINGYSTLIIWFMVCVGHIHTLRSWRASSVVSGRQKEIQPRRYVTK